MTNQDATPGSHFSGPLHIENGDPAQTAFTAIGVAITALTDNTGVVTPDDTIENVPATSTAPGVLADAATRTEVNTSLTAIENNIADLAAKSEELRADLEALKERIT